MTTATTTTAIIHKDQMFIRGIYNDISILVRESDGYVNATKMCDLLGKEILQNL